MRTMLGMLLAVGLLICGGCKTITIPDWISGLGGTNAVPGTVIGTITNATPVPVITNTAPVATSDDLGIEGLPWETGGFSGAQSVRDTGVTITAYSLDMGALRWTIAGTDSWPNDGNTYGLDCLWIKKGGVWRGGKFDWSRKGSCVRPTAAHVQGGGTGYYGGWDRIGGYARGDEWRATTVSKDGKKRGPVVGGVVK